MFRRIAIPRVSWNPGTIVAVLGAELLLVGLMVVNWKLPVALVIALAVGVAALRWPLAAVCLLVGGRLLSTGSTSFLQIGGLGIGFFEPMLALGLAALLVHGVLHRASILPAFPWRAPLLVFGAWQLVGVIWCYRLSSGLSDTVKTGVVLASASVLLAFVRTWRDVLVVLYAWVGMTVLIGVISLTTNFTEIAATGQTWEIASKGGRETGLGQQPNWFAMNLMFGVLLTFGLAWIQRGLLLRLGFALSGLFILFCQLRSGSRGGAYSVVIGSVLVALGHPRLRRWILRIAVVAAALFAWQLVFGADSTSKALNRIWINLGNLWQTDVRGRNWLACIHMFVDTWGRGVGPGGYAQLLEEYDWKLYTSIHRYPHGIFWGILAHYGVVGLAAAAWLLAVVARMARDLLRRTRGTMLEAFAWIMPATMIGYIAWSFVEFNIDDKPFWEYLALFTALCLAVERAEAAGEPLPSGPA